MKRWILAVGWLAGTLGAVAEDPAYPLRAGDLVRAPQGELIGAAGNQAWRDAAAGQGFATRKLVDGRLGGSTGSGPAGVTLDFPVPGLDLDLGFRDFVDLDVQLPKHFAGRVELVFRPDWLAADLAPPRVLLPAAGLVADGSRQRYRIDLGLVPRWRGFLRQLAVVVTPEPGKGGVLSFGRMEVGDAPGTEVEPNPALNLKPGMKVGELRKLESKHGCIWWQPSHEAEGFDPRIMPRRALRMLEETWQVTVKLMGYRDPCLGVDPQSRTRRRINHITWYDGFWMSGGDPPHFNVSQGGLHDEGRGNPVPHEFAHCVQAGQLDFLNGCHWESHANYLRFRRNLHFREFTGVEPIPFHTLLHANYFQDHPRLIYADYRPYFYLDGDPDGLGFGPNFSARLWREGKRDERFWDRLRDLLPAGVSREQVAAGMARSWASFDFPGGAEMVAAHFGEDPEGRLRKFRYLTPLVALPDRPGRWAVPLAKAPMKFGWCLHEIVPSGPRVRALLEGIDVAGEGESWRWGFVGFGADGKIHQSPIFEPGPGEFVVPDDCRRVLLFVCATPADGGLAYPRPSPGTAVDHHPQHRRYPYELVFREAAPKPRVLERAACEGRAHPNGGGFVARGAVVEPGAYIGPAARVLDGAQVRGQARILDRAVVMERATVADQAVVSGEAVVGGEARISGRARVRGFAVVRDQAQVRERARVGDFAELGGRQEVAGEAILRGLASPLDASKIGGTAILDGDYAMFFNLGDGVHFHHVPWGGWYFDEFAAKLTKPRGMIASYRFRESEGAQAMDEAGALLATLRGQPARESGALELGGADQYLALDSSLTDAAAATWMMGVTVGGSRPQPLFSINDWKEEGLLLGIADKNRLAAVLSRDGEPPVTVASAVPLVRGKRVSVALRLDGRTAAIFLDGRKVGEKPWAHAPDLFFHDAVSAAPTAVRVARDAKGKGFEGALHGFRAFNVALDDAEIAARSAELSAP